MYKPKMLILTLALCALIGGYPRAEYGQDDGDLPDQNDVEPVMIALTRLDVNDLILDISDQSLDVNDQALELRWKINNGSDNDVWLCDNVGWDEERFEVYLVEKDQTLVVRRRLDVQSWGVYYIWPAAWYVRFRPGDERVESLSLTMPVRSTKLFVPGEAEYGIKYARRLVFEIGYHTKDLAKMILDSKESDEDPNMIEKVGIPYLIPLSEGEHVLRITVDGVLIPYEDIPVDYFP